MTTSEGYRYPSVRGVNASLCAKALADAGIIERDQIGEAFSVMQKSVFDSLEKAMGELRQDILEMDCVVRLKLMPANKTIAALCQRLVDSNPDCLKMDAIKTKRLDELHALLGSPPND